MAAVACVLLDHVDEHRAQRDGLAVAHDARAVEVGAAVDKAFGEADLLTPGRPRFSDAGKVGRGVPEAGVPVVAVAEVVRRLLAGEHDTEPVALHVGHVADEAEHRQVGWGYRAARHLLGVEPLAFELERLAVGVQVVREGSTLADRSSTAAGVVAGLDEHVAPGEVPLGHGLLVFVVGRHERAVFPNTLDLREQALRSGRRSPVAHGTPCGRSVDDRAGEQELLAQGVPESFLISAPQGASPATSWSRPATSPTRTQPDGGTEDHTPNHCSAPYASNRSTSVSPQLHRYAQRTVVGNLGAEHHRLPGERAGEPFKCRCARLGAVPAPPYLWYERVTELGFHGVGTNVTGAVDVAPIEGDRADHRSAQIDHEETGTPAHLGHRARELLTRSGATEVGAHLSRDEELDERRTVPGLGVT